MFQLAKNDMSLLPLKNIGVWLMLLAVDLMSVLLTQGKPLGYVLAIFINLAVLIQLIADLEVKVNIRIQLFSLPVSKQEIVTGKMVLTLWLSLLITAKMAIVGWFICYYSPHIYHSTVILNANFGQLFTGLCYGLMLSINLFFCYFLLYFRFRIWENSNFSSFSLIIFALVIPQLVKLLTADLWLIVLQGILLTAIIGFFCLKYGTKSLLQKSADD